MLEGSESDFVEVPFGRKISQREELRLVNGPVWLGWDVALQDGWTLKQDHVVKYTMDANGNRSPWPGLVYSLYHGDDEHPVLRLQCVPVHFNKQRRQRLARIGESIPSSEEARRQANRIIDGLLKKTADSDSCF